MKKMTNLISIYLIILLCGSACSKRSNTVPEYLLGDWIILEDESIKVSNIEADSSNIDWEKRKNYIKDKKLKISPSQIQTNSDKPESIKMMSQHGSSIYGFENSEFGTSISIKYIDKDFIRVDWSVTSVEYYKRSR